MVVRDISNCIIRMRYLYGDRRVFTVPSKVQDRRSGASDPTYARNFRYMEAAEDDRNISVSCRRVML